MERELILQEDDAAPDATEFFKMDFRDRIGIPFDKWRQKAKREFDKEAGQTTYTLNNIQVEITADHPFYVVYEITKNSNEDVLQSNK